MLQIQNELCNIPSADLDGGGTGKRIVSCIVCEERSDEGIRFFRDGCCGTLRTIDGCGDKRVIEQIIVASRGRNPDNPSDRTTGAPTEQRLEPNQDGICNALTTVQKDNYVLEIRNGKHESVDIKEHQNGIWQENPQGL